MRSVPRWVLLSSMCAPVILVCGWSIAAVLHGPAYDPASTTISILASNGAGGYWVMTSALIALGACHVATACGLYPAAYPGRLALCGGGVSAMLLAAFPAPQSGGSLKHGAVVAVGFCLLALWPVLAVRREAAGRGLTTGRERRTAPAPPPAGSTPWALRRGPSLMATALMWFGGAWFLLALLANDAAGAAERVLTFAQSLWPLVVVLSCLRQPGPPVSRERRRT